MAGLFSSTSDERAQTTLDFAIAMVIMIGFVSSTFLIGGSPIVNQDSGVASIQSEAERALVEIEANLLTDSKGVYTSNRLANVDSGLEDFRSNTDLPEEDYNVALVLIAITPNNKPNLFEGEGDTRHYGKDIPNIGVENATKMSTLDGRPVRVKVAVWRNAST